MELRLHRVATKICDTVEKFELRAVHQIKQDANQLEWKKIALVIDRLLFWVFTIATFVSASLILFSSPYGPNWETVFN